MMSSSRNYLVIGIAVIVVALGGTFFFTDWWSGGTPAESPSPPYTGPVFTDATPLAAVPKLTIAGGSWLGIAGMNVQAVDGTPAVAGQPILRLVAIPTDSVHTLAAQITGLNKGAVYRIAAWVKPQAGADFAIESSDGSPGKPSHSAGSFDLATHRVRQAAGPANPHVEQGSDDWQKVSIDAPTSTGALVINFYVGQGDNSTYMGDGKLGVIVGGVSVQPRG